MATRVAQKYGAWAGPGPSYFRVVAEIWDYGDYGGGRKLTLYRYVQVNSGGGFGGTSLTNSWGGNIALYGEGNYGQNETTQYRKGYGETLSFPASTTSAYYYGGRKYESSVSISYTVPKPTYTISYDANGGIGAPKNQIKTWGDNLILSETVPTKEGYTFKGWALETAGMVVYQPKGIYSQNTGAKLYAIWEIITYSITFNANGGTGAPSPQSKEWKKNINISRTIPVRNGYKFIGWGVTSDDTTPNYQPGDIYSLDKAITLFAIWKKKGRFYITGNGVIGKGKAFIKLQNGIYVTGIPWIKDEKGIWKKGGA